MTEGEFGAARQSLEAWAFVRRMLDDMTAKVTIESETELELLEGLRVLGRVTALCSELALDVDPQAPWFFNMNSEARLVGGPNPDGEYHLAMIDGRHRYRITGERGTVTYLGFQVFAGHGITPGVRLPMCPTPSSNRVAPGPSPWCWPPRSPRRPSWTGRRRVPIPEDASAVLVRQYVADRAAERLADFRIAPLDPVGPPDRPSDLSLSEGLQAMGWTVVKLMTLHRTVKPELLETAQPAGHGRGRGSRLGKPNTTPDNLYMLGMFRLAR